MKILMDEILLFTGDAFFENGCIQIEDQSIVYAGPRKGAPFFVAERIFDGRGKLAMPGLVNAHAHLGMTLMRGLGSDLPLAQWLNNAMFPIEAHMTAEYASAGTRLGVMEMLRNGVTCVLDSYLFPVASARVLAQSGMRALVCQPMTHEPPDGPFLRSATELYEQWQGQAQDRIHICAGPHAEYTTNADDVLRCMHIAKKFSMPIHLHASETEQEVLDCKRRHDKLSPIQYFDQLGVFELPTIAAHCVHVDSEDVEILRTRGVTVVHNPISNLKLASGVMPLPAMLQRGVRIALGTDGPASNNNLNLWEEVKMTGILHKGLTRDATAVPPLDVLRMATGIGAQGLGFQNVGLLRPGWRADIAMLDLSAAHWTPNFDPAAQLVYAAMGSDVYLTMVDGNILYENGVFNTLDEYQTRLEATEAATQLRTKAGI